MKWNAKPVALVVLILFVLSFLYSKYFYHPTAPTGQAVLTWSASADPTVKGYRVYYGPAPRKDSCPPGGYAQNLNAGKDPSYTIKNLETGKTYYFSVTSYNASGKESCFSKEMQKTITVSRWDRVGMFLGIGKK